MKFAINAGINTLPSFDNLKRWGKRTCDRCPFCGNIQTLAHILSNCSVCLDQGRYTWRHNSVLSSLIDVVRPRLLEGFTLYSDMPGYQAPHGAQFLLISWSHLSGQTFLLLTRLRVLPSFLSLPVHGTEILIVVTHTKKRSMRLFPPIFL